MKILNLRMEQPKFFFFNIPVEESKDLIFPLALT